MRKYWKHWSNWLLVIASLVPIVLSFVRQDWLALGGWVWGTFMLVLYNVVSMWNTELLEATRNVISINERIRRGQL